MTSNTWAEWADQSLPAGAQDIKLGAYTWLGTTILQDKFAQSMQPPNGATPRLRKLFRSVDNVTVEAA